MKMNNLIRKTGSEHAKHVAVLHGGFSGERAISLSSGEACAQGLEEQGFRVTKIDVSHDIAEVLKSVNADVVFNALHGPFGEDGRIQGILEYLSLPYTHSGVLASALAMDKERAKIIARSSGVPVAPSKLVDRFSLLKEHPMPFPYVIKPVYEGSSLGVILVENEHSSIESLLSPQWLYGDIVMVERYIPGIDLTCAVMGDIALEVCEILPVGCSFYNYDSKYSTGKSEHRLPANLSLSVYKKIQEISLCAHRSLGCRGVTRSDFRYDHSSRSDGDIVWLEINTQPGMTKTSLLPEIACFSGYSFSDLLGWIVEDASCLR